MNKNDKIMIGLIVFLVGLLWVYNILGKELGAYVKVSYDGELIDEFTLELDGIYDTKYGNVVEIKSGMVSVIQASCPDGLCIKQGSIDKVGSSIICIPNKLIIELE